MKTTIEDQGTVLKGDIDKRQCENCPSAFSRTYGSGRQTKVCRQVKFCINEEAVQFYYESKKSVPCGICGKDNLDPERPFHEGCIDQS